MSSPFALDGLCAAVTGGARGLGRGITEALLAAGADVVILARRAATDDLRATARALGRKLSNYELDLGDPDAITGAARTALSEHRVDILVNNAGTQARYPAITFPLDAWDHVIGVNLRAVMQLSQLFADPMLQRGFGKIINIASLLSFQGGITVPAYAASKGAVAQLTKALCNEWSSRGINVNAVAPGYMATEMNRDLVDDPRRATEISARIPAGRWGTPDDVGGVVTFLASPAAGYIHGQVIAVDGGWLAR